MKKFFKRDEFIGRISEIVYFFPFSEEQLIDLVEKEMRYWATKAKDKDNITVKWENEVLIVLAGAYDVKYGARYCHIYEEFLV